MRIIKNALLVGAGYVIGTHAGRERYEQLKQQATQLLQRPEVKRVGHRAQDAVKRKLPGGGAEDDAGQAPSGGSGRGPRGETASTGAVGAAQTSTSTDGEDRQALRELAEERIEGLPGETALGNADPAVGVDVDPATYRGDGNG